MAKLTLRVDEDVLRQARRLAKRRGTSVSAMFSQFVRALADPEPGSQEQDDDERE